MFIEMLQYGHRNLTVSSDSLAPVQTSPPQTSSETHHHWHHFNQDIATGETDQDVFCGPSSGDTPQQTLWGLKYAPLFMQSVISNAKNSFGII